MPHKTSDAVLGNCEVASGCKPSGDTIGGKLDLSVTLIITTSLGVAIYAECVGGRKLCEQLELLVSMPDVHLEKHTLTTLVGGSTDLCAYTTVDLKLATAYLLGLYQMPMACMNALYEAFNVKSSDAARATFLVKY